MLGDTGVFVRIATHHDDAKVHGDNAPNLTTRNIAYQLAKASNAEHNVRKVGQVSLAQKTSAESSNVERSNFSRFESEVDVTSGDSTMWYYYYYYWGGWGRMMPMRYYWWRPMRYYGYYWGRSSLLQSLNTEKAHDGMEERSTKAAAAMSQQAGRESSKVTGKSGSLSSTKSASELGWGSGPGSPVQSFPVKGFPMQGFPVNPRMRNFAYMYSYYSPQAGAWALGSGGGYMPWRGSFPRGHHWRFLNWLKHLPKKGSKTETNNADEPLPGGQEEGDQEEKEHGAGEGDAEESSYHD